MAIASRHDVVFSLDHGRARSIFAHLRPGRTPGSAGTKLGVGLMNQTINAFWQAGYQRVLDAFNDNDLDRMARVINDSVTRRRSSAPPGATLQGVLDGLNGVLLASRNFGLEVSAAAIDRIEITESVYHSLSVNDYKSCQDQLQTLFDAVANCRAKLPVSATISCDFDSLAESERKKPTEIIITSMPERETTTEVQRDGGGNIKKTTQVERDIA